jgi:hypothetical protein
MWWAIYDWVLLALWAINAEATYTIIGCDPSDDAKIEGAITEATIMATSKGRLIAVVFLPDATTSC